MVSFTRLFDGARHRKKGGIGIVSALLLVMLLTLPASAALPIQPLDPNIPELPVLTKPQTPTGLVVTKITSDTIELTWTDSSANEEGFFIHRKTEGASGYNSVGHVGANVTTFQNTGLTPETKYYYVVTAHNSLGSSSFSNEANGTTLSAAPASPPIAPTLLKAEPEGETQIHLTWQNNCTNETGFYIYRKTDGESSFVKVDDTGSGGWNGYGDTGLEPGTKYYYYVSAYNAEGSADSNILSATTKGVPLTLKPNAPSDLKATAISSSEAALIWKDNSNNESAFVLERSLTQAGGYTVIATLQPDSTSYDDSGLSAATTYYYRIKASNSAGDSAYSALASINTPESQVVQPPIIEPPTADNNNTMVLLFYIGKDQYYANNTPSPMDTAPVIKENRTLLPIRFVAVPLGAQVGWDAATSKVTIAHNGTTIEMWIGKNTALVNGVEKRIDPDNPAVTPIIMPPGRTMLPLRFISENLGCQVDWNSELREAKVTYPKP